MQSHEPALSSGVSLHSTSIGQWLPANDEGGVESEYRAELPAREIIARIHRLLGAERRTERLICRYLADLADRVRDQRDWELGAYADELHAARCYFGLGARDTRERVRIGRALRQLPHIEQAFIEGRLSYSRVREITRVATALDEVIWLQLAQALDMRALERRVAGAGEPVAAYEADSTSSPVANDRVSNTSQQLVRMEWTNAHSVRVSFELSAAEWALVERALEGAKRASDAGLSDGAALEAVARDALMAQTETVEASDPRRAVVLYECQRCGKGELDTGAGLLELHPASAAALGCGAAAIDLAEEGHTVQRGGPLPAATRRAVMLRDQCRCRVPGCNRRRYVDVHHIVGQAEGGEHSRRNCLVLCTTHHRLLHDGQLQLGGDAEGNVVFRDALGRQITENKDPGATQGGSSIPRDASAQLLDVIGRRGGWMVDELAEKSGLSISDANAALMTLLLGGRVRQGELGFDPT